jgi:hypothetical protein
VTRFAEGTTVPTERSRAEIERLVQRHGATSFGHLTNADGATILFEVRSRRLRFSLPLPKRNAFRTEDKWRAEERRRWRCLLLAIKSKFETVDNGIVSFDEEFLAHIIVPGTKETIGSWAAPQIAEAYERGTHMPPLLSVGGP